MRIADVWLAPLLVGLCVSTSVTPASAQDWSLTRPDRPRSGGRRRPPERPRRGAGEEPEAGPTRTEVLAERYLRVLEADPSDGFAFQRLVDLHRERDGNVQALREHLEARLSTDEDTFVVRMLLGHLLRDSGDPDRAADHYREAAAGRPRDASPWIALGRMARGAGNLDQSRSAYEAAMERVGQGPVRREIQRALGELAIERSDFEGAERAYRALAGASDGPFLQTEYARALRERGHAERAVQEYRRVLGRLRGDRRVLPPIQLELARAQLESGATDDAIATLETALRTAGRRDGVRAELYDTMVEAYRRSDRLNELVDTFSQQPATFETLSRLGRLQDELGRDDDALRSYRGALRRNRRDLDVRRAVIQILLRSGRIEDAIGEYRSLIGLAPREPNFVVELARTLIQIGRREEALRETERVSRRYPREPAVHRALAQLYARAGEDERAAREVAILARIEPDDPVHLIALGAQKLEAGDRSGAIRTWRRILTTGSDRGQAHATLGGVFADHDLLAEAATEYRAAADADPNRIDYVRGLASVYERQRKEVEAVEQWRRVLSLGRDDRAARREARQRIVGIWQRARRLPAEVARLQARFQADPPEVESGRFLAEAYRRLGPNHLADAESVLMRVAELDPGDVESLAALERLKVARGDLQGAVEILRRLVDADPRQAASHLQRMAEHALALYRDEEAVRYAAAAVEASPSDAAGHRRLGDLYRARQDATRAIASYRRALELNDRLFSTHFDLAELLLASGRSDEADALYLEVMQRSPDDDRVARAVRASMQIHLGDGSLEALERHLLPLALSRSNRPVFRKLTVELYDGLTSPLIRVASRGAEGSSEAEASLRRVGARAIKPLLEALADSDPAQRQLAVNMLAHVGNANAASPLLALAESDESVGLRQQALAAAGAVGRPAIVPQLKALAEGRERRLRGVATWALGRVGGTRATQALSELLVGGDATVRAFAALGLGVSGDPAVGGALAARLVDDSSAQVQRASALALGLLGDADRVAALSTTLAQSSGRVAATAAVALGMLGDATAVGPLARAALDPDAGLRSTALMSLQRLGDPARPIRRRLPLPTSQAVHPYIDRIVSGWRRSPAPDATPREVPGLDAAFVAAARDALRGPSERVWAALDALDERARYSGEDELGWAELLPELRVVAEHPDGALRRGVIPLLGRIDDPSAHAALVAALSDPEAAVQREALSVLPANVEGAEGPVTGLLREHPAWSIRTLAAQALDRLGTGGEALRDALGQDDYAFVRQAAARALGRRAPEAPTISTLERALTNDPAREVRVAAARALLSFPGQGPQAIERAIEAGGPRSRAAVRRARRDLSGEARGGPH